MNLDNIELCAVTSIKAGDLEKFFKSKVEFSHKLKDLMSDWETSRLLNENMAKSKKYETATFEEKLVIREFVEKTINLSIKKIILEKAYDKTIRTGHPLITSDQYLSSILTKDLIFSCMRGVFNNIEELMDIYEKMNKKPNILEKFFKKLN